MNTLYRAVFVDVWPWWIGGPAIGLYVLALLLGKNRLLSASSTYQYLVDRAIPGWLGKKESASDWLTGPLAPDDPEPAWLGRFFAGLFLGGALSMALGGAFAFDASLPGLDATYPYAAGSQAAILGFSGLLIGFGTRMGGGCTSGHCIVGVSGLQTPSMIATAVFFGGGIAASFAAEWLVAAVAV